MKGEPVEFSGRWYGGQDRSIFRLSANGVLMVKGEPSSALARIPDHYAIDGAQLRELGLAIVRLTKPTPKRSRRK